MALLNPKGLSKDPILLQFATTQMVDLDRWIGEMTLANLGCENYGDDDWVGCFNVRAIGEGGVEGTSNWGITSQSTTCFYFMTPRHVTDFVDFVFVGRAA